MYSIVPLAGPDLWDEQTGFRPLTLFEGKPLIQTVLNSRPWINSHELLPQNLIFVLREVPQLADLIQFLADTFKGCRWIVLSTLTQGALLSALAGVSLIEKWESPLVIDLADILYESDLSIEQCLHLDRRIEGVLPYFESQNPAYSYLAMDEQGWVSQTREKKVISHYASAGTYIFRSSHEYVKATEFALKNPEISTYKGSFFICPCYNGLSYIKPYPVTLRASMSLEFKTHKGFL